MIKKRFISMLVLLMTAVSGAWADTTVTWEGTKLQSIAVCKGYNFNVTTESMTVDGITITANGGYLLNDDQEGVMLLSGAANGVVFSAENNIKSITITSTGRSKFTPDGGYQVSGGSHTYEVSPAATSYGFANSVKIKGITKIEITLEGAPAAAYTVTANLANGAYWATFYSNAGNYQAPEGTQVFKVALTGSTLEMTEITDRIVNAGQGVVLKSSSASIELASAASGTTDEGGYSGNSLEGTMTQINTTGANDYYVLGGTNGAGFYKLADTGTIGANKAYLTYSGTLGGAREFFLFDETTGIEMPTAEDGNADAVVYDLQGRRVLNPTKGLYIVNGKKVFINK